MKPKNKVFFIFGVIILALAIAGYFRATPGAEDQAGAQPGIAITPESFDFGEIDYSRIVESSFRIKNLGKEILEIKRVATSCACTTAEVLKDRIEPGEETELLVSYDTAAMGRSSHGMGKQERIIYVKSNDPLNPQVTVMIYAYVK